MPRQNRVTPFGTIIATPERGTYMGNRGRLHDERGIIRRPWKVKRWLVCMLHFRGRQRTIMAPNRYTELFFLDEATALAAGHRPCAECRHDRFIAFCDGWKAAHPEIPRNRRPTADEIDDQLHEERLAVDRLKEPCDAHLNEVPDGVFVTSPAWGEHAYLVLDARLLKWSPGGYTEIRDRPSGAQVSVLTPKSTVETIGAGYTPEIHPSAHAVAAPR